MAIDSAPVKLGIAIPTYKQIESIFFQCFLQLLFSKHDFSINIFTIDVTGIDVARNSLGEQFLASDCTHLLFLDNDMVFPPNTPELLLRHEKEVVSGLYFLRKNISPAIYSFQDGNYKRMAEVPSDPLIKVGAVGFGCILIRREVLEKLSKKWGLCFRTELKSAREVITEDVHFCDLCRKEGIEIFVDTRLILGHVGGIIPEQLFNKNVY